MRVLTKSAAQPSTSRSSTAVSAAVSTASGVRWWLISVPIHAGFGGQETPRELLSFVLSGGERVLPVFSSEDDARLLSEDAATGDWRAFEVGVGELLVLLAGPACEGVCVLALDPPAGVPAAVSAALVGVRPEEFARRLAEEVVPDDRLGAR